MADILTRKLELFQRLSDADRALIERATGRRQHVAGRCEIVGQGQRQNGVILIVGGHACRSKLLRSGGRQIFASMIPGDLSDLDAHLLPAVDHTISSVSECTYVDIPRERVADLLAAPRVARAMRCAALVDVAITREWLVNLGQRSAERRIGHYFCELLVRLEAVDLAAEGEIPFPLTQSDLADVMGLSAVHVNRTLQSLRTRGLINLQGRHLMIRDVRRLQELSGFNPDYLAYDRARPALPQAAHERISSVHLETRPQTQ